MEHSIGKFHRPSGTVPFVIKHQGVTVARPMNACLDADGRHDRAASLARAADLAKGMAHKIEIGLFGPPQP